MKAIRFARFGGPAGISISDLLIAGWCPGSS